MNNLNVVLSFLHARQENLRLRIELCRFRNDNPHHDEAREIEVGQIIKQIEGWIREQ